MAVREQNTTKSGLVLDSLEVKNFRAFKHLTIEKLGRVNLITGKNNVGKTTLLEALWIYAKRRSPEVLRSLLTNRDELKLFTTTNAHDILLNLGSPGHLPAFEYARNDAPANDDLSWPFMSLLHMADGGYSPGTAIINVPGKNTITISIRSDDITIEHDGRTIYSGPLESIYYESADIKRRIDEPGTPRSREPLKEIPAAFVQSLSYDLEYQSKLWAEAKQEGRNADVLDALSLIVPNIDDIEFAETSSPGKTARRVTVTRRGWDPVPLSSLGEGAKRLLQISLAIVHAKDGILLLDELENGIHYSVLPDIWRYIFAAAHRLNVQVFVTTHSWECIEAFQDAADADDDPNSGVLVRLQNKGGEVTSTVFDERRLGIVARDGIEVR